MCINPQCIKRFRSLQGRNQHYNLRQRCKQHWLNHLRRQESVPNDALNFNESNDVTVLASDLQSDLDTEDEADELQDQHFLVDESPMLWDISEDLNSLDGSTRTSSFIEEFPGAAKVIGKGLNLYARLLQRDEHRTNRDIAGLWYPFAGHVEWQLVKWLSSLQIPMAKIDEFLQMDYVRLKRQRPSNLIVIFDRCKGNHYHFLPQRK